MFWKHWFKNKDVKKSQLTLAVEALTAIKPSSLSRVFSSDMSIHKLTVCKPNVEEYCELLTALIHTIEDDRLLYASGLDVNVRSVYIRDFFTSKKHMMLDPVEASSELIELSVEFLKLYENKEKLSEKSFNLEKNLMLSQQVASNLCVLSKEL